MKALPHPAVLSTLLNEGSSFAASSSSEIRTLLSLGVAPQRLLYNHPIKRPEEISEAIELGCEALVVDNAAEIEKLAGFRGRATGVLRIGFRSSDAGGDLRRKFGCQMEDAMGLLELGNRLQVPITGLSFHVGSQCASSRGHVKAISDCLALAKQASAAGLPPIRILDIGGGFPVGYHVPTPEIEEFCAPIREALSLCPGRYARRRRAGPVPGRPGRRGRSPPSSGRPGAAMYPGITWTTACTAPLAASCMTLLGIPSRSCRAREGSPRPSVLAGPTCDSVDVIAEGVLLPELEIGDIVAGAVMGAYTAASASEFNSIPRTKLIDPERTLPVRIGGRDGARRQKRYRIVNDELALNQLCCGMPAARFVTFLAVNGANLDMLRAVGALILGPNAS